MARRHRFAFLIPVALLLVTACSQSGPIRRERGAPASPPSASANRPRALVGWRSSAEPAASPTKRQRAVAQRPARARWPRPRSGRGVGLHRLGGGERSGHSIYETPDSHAIAALVQVASDGAAARFGALKGNPEATVVTGLGDEAVWLPAPAAVELHVLKGATLLSLAVGTLSGVPIDGLPDDISPDQLLDLAKKFGTIAVARL